MYVAVRICASGLRGCFSFGTDVVGGSVITRQRRNAATNGNTADLGTSHSDLATTRYVIVLYLILFSLARGLIYAQALLEYVIFSMWVRSVTKMLPFVKFAQDKVLTFFILREKC